MIGLVRGVITYSLIWPASALTQDYLENGRTIMNANWRKALRYAFFGTVCLAPVSHSWMKLTNRYFKKKTLKTAITRAVVEQFTYTPFSLLYFFFGMTLLEGKTLDDGVLEVREKFWSTFFTGMVVWPPAQTINFYYLHENNRLIFIGAVSFAWTIYLAHMKCIACKTDKTK